MDGRDSGPLYRVGQKGLQDFEISRFNVVKGEKLAPICVSDNFGKIDEKSHNPM